MEQGKSTHDINQNNLDHELNQNNFSNDIEIEKIDEDKIPPETSKVKNKEN